MGQGPLLSGKEGMDIVYALNVIAGGFSILTSVFLKRFQTSPSLQKRGIGSL